MGHPVFPLPGTCVGTASIGVPTGLTFAGRSVRRVDWGSGQKFMAISRDRSKSEVRKRRDLRPIVLLAVFGALFLGLLVVGVQVVRVHYLADSESQSLNAQRSNLEAGADSSASSSSQDPALASSSDAKSTGSQEEESEGSAADERSAAGDAEEEEALRTSIVGAVLDDTGELLSGATVTARPVDASQGSANDVPSPAGQLTQQTDNLGSFEFTDLAEGEYELSASKGEDFLPAGLQVRTGMQNAEIILQRLRIIQVYGQVSDEFGEPLPKVNIRTLGTRHKVQTDENGEYDILTAPMKAGSSPVLDFSLQDFKETRRRVEAALDPATTEVRLDVQMASESEEPEVALSGQVLGPLGEAVVDVKVRLGSVKSQTNFSATTDRSGMFSFPEVEVGDGYNLVVKPSNDYEGYESDRFSLGPDDGFREIVLEAVDYSKLSGTVTDLTGRPLGGFTLSLRGVGNNAQSPVLVETDGSGYFELDKLRTGEIRLESRSRPMLRASNIVLKPGENAHIDVPLDWGGDWIFGQVVDSQGKPVSGASVVVTWQDVFQGLVSESRRDVRSDFEGYFTISNLGADDYTLTVQAPGHETTRIQHQLGGGSMEVQVLLPTIGAANRTGGGN